jgi:hypothetical protein
VPGAARSAPSAASGPQRVGAGPPAAPHRDRYHPLSRVPAGTPSPHRDSGAAPPSPTPRGDHRHIVRSSPRQVDAVASDPARDRARPVCAAAGPRSTCSSAPRAAAPRRATHRPAPRHRDPSRARPPR